MVVFSELDHGWKLVSTFAKKLILDVWQDSQYAYVIWQLCTGLQTKKILK